MYNGVSMSDGVVVCTSVYLHMHVSTRMTEHQRRRHLALRRETALGSALTLTAPGGDSHSSGHSALCTSAAFALLCIFHFRLFCTG